MKALLLGVNFFSIKLDWPFSVAIILGPSWYNYATSSLFWLSVWLLGNLGQIVGTVAYVNVFYLSHITFNNPKKIDFASCARNKFVVGFLPLIVAFSGGVSASFERDNCGYAFRYKWFQWGN